MRKITFFILLAFAWYMAPAQFKLTDSRMPQPGDKQLCHYIDTTGFSPGAAGTGVTWNFSSFSDSVQPFYLEAIDPATGPHSADFGANSTVGIRDGAGNYTYYKLATGTYSITGVNNSLTLSNNAVYSDPGLRYNLPTTFNMTYTDSLKGQFSALAGIAYRKGEVNTTVDGSGTIALPNGSTHNGVIRVKHIITIRDSANIFGNTIISNATTTYYEWYDSTQRLPIMTYYRVQGNAMGNAIDEYLVYYAVPDTSTGVEEIASSIDFSVSPNPFAGSARLSLSLENSGKVQIDLIDLSGRIVRNLAADLFGAGKHDMIIDGSNLQPGVYFVRMRNQNSEVTRKLVHF